MAVLVKVDGIMSEKKTGEGKSWWANFVLEQEATTRLEDHEPAPWRLRFKAWGDTAQQIDSIEEGTKVLVTGEFVCEDFMWNDKIIPGKQVKVTTIELAGDGSLVDQVAVATILEEELDKLVAGKKDDEDDLPW